MKFAVSEVTEWPGMRESRQKSPLNAILNQSLYSPV